MADHQRDTRQRSIDDHYCAEPSCEFNGKPWQQGVCFNDQVTQNTIDRMMQDGDRILAEMHHVRDTQFKNKPDEYIRWLEAMNESAMMNWHSTLNECIALRVQNRRLRENAPTARSRHGTSEQ